MNFSASVHSKLIPENIITEVLWTAWNDTNQVSGILKLDPANKEKFVPIERVDHQTLADWAMEKLGMDKVEQQLKGAGRA